jgi:hypothetical protein
MTLTLFAHDRHSKGGSIPVVALWIGVCGPLAFPRLQLVPLQISLDPTIEHAQVLITSLVGCIEGVLLSFALLRRCRGNVRQSDAQWAIAALSLSGLFLGWQASVTIALLTVVTRITACLMPIHWQAFRFPLAGHIAVATSIQLLLWRPIVIVLERADGRMPLAVAAFAVVTTLVLSRILDLAEAGAARIEDAPVKPVFIEHDFT